VGVKARRFPDKPSLAAELRGALGEGTVVLFKASRGAALEDVLTGLPVADKEA
jgi:UDP-N-acetylmuramyl pentapeptide synthase